MRNNTKNTNQTHPHSVNQTNIKNTDQSNKTIQCTYCGSKVYKKNGKYEGVQRYCCKDCHRAFSDKIRKFTYKDKERFLDMYLNNVGIRKAAHFIGCSPSLLIEWIRQFSDNLKCRLEKSQEVLDEKIPDIIEMDEIYTRIKKGLIECKYGLLILDNDIKLLRMSSEQQNPAQQTYMKE